MQGIMVKIVKKYNAKIIAMIMEFALKESACVARIGEVKPAM
jgi:hypothetical protein